MKTNLIVIATALGLTACAGPSSEVEVKNRSKFPAREVSISVGGNDLHINAIAPGEETSVFYAPKTDSSISASFREGRSSLMKTCAADVYVTSPSRDHFLLIIDDEGCVVQRKSGGD